MAPLVVAGGHECVSDDSGDIGAGESCKGDYNISEALVYPLFRIGAAQLLSGWLLSGRRR